MKKIDLIQIMEIADYLNKAEWVSVLIALNRNGQIHNFLNMINKPDLLNLISSENNQKCGK